MLDVSYISIKLEGKREQIPRMENFRYTDPVGFLLELDQEGQGQSPRWRSKRGLGGA